MVISIWRGDYCVTTHEVPIAEVPDVIQAIAQALLPAASTGEQATAS